MYKKVSKQIILMLGVTAILTVPSLVLQNSHAQSNANLQNTVLSMHNQDEFPLEFRRLRGGAVSAEARDTPIHWLRMGTYALSRIAVRCYRWRY